MAKDAPSHPRPLTLRLLTAPAHAHQKSSHRPQKKAMAASYRLSWKMGCRVGEGQF
ncbi:DUF3108 domain-containing protein [Lacticaseibacillus huelsenbergensis]|uniref:DUF3108 domain-containing protein n=1 Tax=Lacticaseibacillus huelsenbergensis TaxID=3035291 RepID=A0ABY8DNP1_9LACO|nr:MULTISPECIES: DUF3108 domain-containing protein [Lacticaseibacillus]MDG3061789.1 DUF3108 domain-containing protein [Lacticaseibacillus sp. BCRC 81376]WFB38599.1 DUF3108 domain-containing protein [Lacticaseibacillus huelsenbergensis]WFB43024.1 DUF3108 domain-containing protein [Lacticaseibacillus huelsenbergensis]